MAGNYICNVPKCIKVRYVMHRKSRKNSGNSLDDDFDI